MASQATITMDSSFGGCGDCPQMGDQMTTHMSMKWEHDGADLRFADVHSVSAPEFLDDALLFSFEPASSSPDAKSGEFDPQYSYSALGDIPFVGGYDLESLLSEQAPLPESVGVPALDHEQDISWLTDSADVSELIEISEPFKDVSAPGSPDSGISSLSAASSPDEAHSPELHSSPEPLAHDASTLQHTPVCPQPTVIDTSQLPIVSDEDLALLQSLWEKDSQIESHSSLTSEALLTTVALEPIGPAKLPLQPVSPSRKSCKAAKALSSKEKKERKRSQNKNAATRYREKKREEARVIYEQQTELEDKHKSLKDKVTLITREMEYMKELLIEVYRAKGLLE